MRIKEVEGIVGITRKNIRFYEKEGLLSPGRESENSYRDYSDRDLMQLKRIKLLRKLDMPLSSIKLLLDGEITLASAARQHTGELETRKHSIEQAQFLCSRLLENNETIENIDTDSYLLQIDELEKEGTIFVDIRKHDVRKKYFGPVAACCCVVLFAAAMIAGVLWLNGQEPAPPGLLYLLIAILAVLAIGTVAALITRIKEIRGGEENDLSNY